MRSDHPIGENKHLDQRPVPLFVKLISMRLRPCPVAIDDGAIVPAQCVQRSRADAGPDPALPILLPFHGADPPRSSPDRQADGLCDTLRTSSPKFADSRRIGVALADQDDRDSDGASLLHPKPSLMVLTRPSRNQKVPQQLCVLYADRCGGATHHHVLHPRQRPVDLPAPTEKALWERWQRYCHDHHPRLLTRGRCAALTHPQTKRSAASPPEVSHGTSHKRKSSPMLTSTVFLALRQTCLDTRSGWAALRIMKCAAVVRRIVSWWTAFYTPLDSIIFTYQIVPPHVLRAAHIAPILRC